MDKNIAPTIAITSVTFEETSDSAQMFPNISQLAAKATEISLDALTTDIVDTIEQFRATLNQLPQPASGYCVDSVSMTLRIDASGKVSLVGEMASLCSSGITVTFKRQTGS